MSHLWDIAQAHMDEYGVRAAALARRMGTSPQTLDSWKNRGVRSLPSRALLEALARETRTPYEDVLAAALADIDYLPKERDGHAAPTTQGSLTPTPPPAGAPGPAQPEHTRPPVGPAPAADSAPRTGPKVVPPDAHRVLRASSTDRRGHGRS